MNSKWHTIISFAKSIIRIIGCIIAIISLYTSEHVMLAFISVPVSFLIAEILGILEEIGDKR